MAERDVSVLVVEDDRITREGLGLLLEASPGFAASGLCGSLEECLLRRVEPPPDVVLLDIHLPGKSGADGVPLLKERFPDAAILMLTVFEDDANVFRCLCSGADGYVLKRTPPVELLAYVRDAAGGGAPMSPEIARKVVLLFRKLGSPDAVGCRLTDQETKLLRLLGDGYSYEGAGRELGVSVNTVRKYVRSVYEKLHVHSKAEAVSKALRSGLI